MKKILLCLLVWALACVPAFAQGKTSVLVLGKNKGTVASIKANGHTLLDAQSTTKKIGGTVELFSAARQLKVAFPGMYAILSAPSRDIFINAELHKLPVEVTVSGGRIYVPVEFFLLPQVQQALDREITFENNALVVEKHYNVALDEVAQLTEQDELRFTLRNSSAYSLKQVNGHTLQVTFPNAILKRTATQRPKDSFVRSFTLSQRGADTVLEIILGTQGKQWKTTDTAHGVVVSVSAKPVAPAADRTVLEPSVVAAEPESEALVPSVLSEEEDDAEELDLHATAAGVTQAPVMTAAVPPTISAAPLPVMKAVSKDKIRIVIDPGHGGKDPGAVRKGSAREKELNLAVAKHLYNYLKKQNFDVKLTRDNDTFVTLAGRSKMANEYKADLFMSVHTNAAKRPTPNGFEVYFRSDKATDKEAAEIAEFENESLQYEETHYSFVDKLLQSLAKNEYMNE
ncbi:MAG: N-acetylmuramoyl-L-alanine amidase, partial [Elusimicrobiaceae bacterium]|nr:N-acetylmuramoyl-L-alanine amidase [Elusimicrobiaceae bacterium]